MNHLSTIQQLAILVLPILFAITLHEVAHGWVAAKLGDKTAQMMGRLTINPIKHIDPIGTIAVPALLFFISGFMFGWAKPVPISWQNLNNPKRDMAYVALAGPGANLIMALFWGLIAKLSSLFIAVSSTAGLALLYMGIAGIFINIALMVLNLIPIPPLDGSRVVSSLISDQWSYYYNQLEPYGFFILLALIFTGVLFRIILIPLFIMVHLIMNLYHIPMNHLFTFLGQ